MNALHNSQYVVQYALSTKQEENVLGHKINILSHTTRLATCLCTIHFTANTIKAHVLFYRTNTNTHTEREIVGETDTLLEQSPRHKRMARIVF